MLLKYEVKDNNVEQALRVLKENFKEMVFFKIIKIKNTIYEKPSEKFSKKRILQENIKRLKNYK